LYSSDGISNDPVLEVADNSASAEAVGIRVKINGAKTDYTDGIYVTNSATTNTPGADKFGVRIKNTGNWVGAGSTNYGLYIEEPTGGTTNTAAWIDGCVEITDAVDIGGVLTVDEYLNVGINPPVALPDGGAYFDSMVRIRTEEGGGGIFVLEHDWAFPIHTGTGSFDLTGGAYENYFTATAPIFEAEDAELNNFIAVISGAYLGYAAEIINYIDTTHVVLDTLGWTIDLADLPFAIVRHPILFVGDGNKVGVNAQDVGGFHVDSNDYVGECILDVELDVGIDDASAICVEVDANGHSASEALRIRYNTGDLQPGDHAALLKMSMDETLAVNSDATTHIDFIELLTTDTEDATKHAIHIGQSFDSALIVSSGTEEDPDHGYTVVPDVATNRVTGAPGVGTAFLEASASDVEIFNADNDYVLIGSDATFEAIDAILVSGANVDVQETYYYSTGAGTWSPLIVSDTVNGFRQSGTITFNAPAGWALSNATVPAGAAITNAYYVKIVRTRNNVGAPPVEDYFKTYTSSSTTDFEIRGDGTIRPVEMADASAPNNSLYYSTTQSKLVYKDSVGTVHDLW